MANEIARHIKDLVAIKPIHIFKDSRQAISNYNWNLVMDLETSFYDLVYINIENIITKHIEYKL